MKSKTIILAGFLLLAGCVTENRVRGWLDDHPAAGARILSDLYPVRSGYLPGKDSVRYEAVPVNIPGGMVGLFLPTNPLLDNTHRQVKAGNVSADASFTGAGWQVKCRADSLQLLLDSAREVHLRVDTQLIENTVHVRALQGDSARLVQQVDEAVTRGNNLEKRALYAFIALAFLALWTFRAPIINVVKKVIS